ncbi:MAG: acetyl-CoA carboxylase carboxyltransferase subunit alpha [Planctomycetota bacterium]
MVTRQDEIFRDSLPFEKPIVELELKIEDLENLAKSTGMDLSREVKPLRELHDKLLRKIFAELTPWEKVQLARHPLRPLTSDYINLMVDDFVELHGDKLFAEDRAIVTGLGRIGGERVMIVGHRKGKKTEERVGCNWGMAHPEGYRKALAKMKLAEKFALPVVTLINTPGAYPGIGAEERGQAGAIAKNILEMSLLRTPILSVVLGEGGSGGALGIGVCDRLLMLQYSYYSVISPEGCAAILWKDGDKKTQAAGALRITAADLQELGIVDEVIEEPLGGGHRNPAKVAITLRDRLLAHLAELRSLPVETLLERRYAKYRRIGSDDS